MQRALLAVYRQEPTVEQGGLKIGGPSSDVLPSGFVRGVKMSTFSRRELIVRAAAASAGLAFGFSSDLERARGSSSPGVIWGIYSEPADAILSLESDCGRKFAGARINTGFGATFPSRQISTAYDAGRRWSYRNLDTYTVQAGTNRAVSWAAIAAGKYDAYFRSCAQSIRLDGRWTATNPYHFAFRHEMAVNTPTQPSGGTSAEYRAAFRHVRAVFDAAGATVNHGGNVAFCFSPTSGMFQPTAKSGHTVAEFDPGHGYYEFVGVDLYEHYGAAYRRSAKAWLDPVHDFATRAGHRFIVGELGIAELDDPTAKANYISDIAAVIKSYGLSGPGSCAAVLWTNKVDPAGDYRLNSSPGALASFAAAGDDPIFSTVAG